MSFPLTPANNQTAIINGVSYVWNQSVGAWLRIKTTASTAITGNTITVLSSLVFPDGTTQTTAATGVDSYARAVNNSQNTNISAVDTYAGSAYNKANNALPLTGGTITGSLSVSQDVTVTGNLTVLGNSTTITTNTLEVSDSLIYLGGGNYSSDAVDIGIIGHYSDGANAHSGIIRDPNLKEWIFFKGYTPEIESNNLIDINHASFAYANVYSSYFKGNLITNGVNIYTHTGAAFTQANTNASEITALQGVNTTQNTNITAVDTYATGAYGQANTNAQQIIAIQGVDVWQNTQFTTINSLAQGAYDRANSGARATSSNTAPTSNTVGDLWLSLTDETLYMYSYDGTSNNWVDISGPILRSSNIVVQYSITSNVV